VANLAKIIIENGFAIKNVPDIMQQFIKKNEWQSYITITGNEIVNKSFPEFLQRKPPSGPGCDCEMMLRICQGHSVWDTVNDLCTGAHGGDRGNQWTGGKVNNVNLGKADKGNSKSYLRRRLAKQNPDIFQALNEGKYKSTHQAAIAAGIVKPTTPIMYVKRNIKKLNREELIEILNEIQEILRR